MLYVLVKERNGSWSVVGAHRSERQAHATRDTYQRAIDSDKKKGHKPLHQKVRVVEADRPDVAIGFCTSVLDNPNVIK